MNHIEWNNWMQQQNASFLQSWEWGDFQHSYGRTVHRVHSDSTLNKKTVNGTDGTSNSEVRWAAQVLGHQLPAGRKYLFIPYGPVISGTVDPKVNTEVDLKMSSVPNEILDTVQDVSRHDKAIFVRYEGTRALIGGRPVADVHPAYTRIISLHDPETMLAHMKPKWRYNIRLAERKGVTVRVSQSVEDVADLYALLHATAKRQHIHIHPLSYYQLMISHLGRAGLAHMYFAEYDGQLIAGNMMIGFGHTMTYVHGGSTPEHHAVMAPHLLQWRAMCSAYEAGFTEYDLFGVAPPDQSGSQMNGQSNHVWAGISRFKAGFGGTVRQVGGTYEIPLDTVWYNAYRILKRIWI